MEALRSQAQNAGGQMLSHLGNHEWMNAIGQFVMTVLYPFADNPHIQAIGGTVSVRL